MSSSLPPRATAVLLALVLALLAFRLGAVPLLGPDEPRYTRVAVEMHRAGEWVTPTLQGEPWLEKTPLFYWLAGGAFSVLGETEAAAREFSRGNAWPVPRSLTPTRCASPSPCSACAAVCG